MEKRRPHYPLRQIQAAFSTVRTLRITRTAVQCAERLGITLQGVVDVVAGMQPSQFYKSMTSDADNTIWQDVYHVPRGGIVLYVKLTVDAEGHLVISFKEK